MFWRRYDPVVSLVGVLFLAGRVLAAPGASAPNTLTTEEAAEGWLLLFDGQSLFGWQSQPQEAWQAAQGLLTAQPDRPAQLISTSEWADFVLKMDFQAEPGAQATLVLRDHPQAESAAGAANGYEVVLASADPQRWPVGSVQGRKKADSTGLPPGWHTLEATAQAGSIRLRLDGQEVLCYDDPQPIRRGLLVLRVQKGPVAFRNLKLRPLGLQSIFNGKDLTGWKEYPQMASKFTVTPEGWLRVQGGRGQLESEGQYADFTLQLEVFVNGQGLNSGIFFRCIPGETMNGYECQIHNGFLDGDRNKPKDCGTGGIFRRQNARRVVADDFQWFTLTIHAHGPHIATWVNGYPVADWTDTRSADPNPRRGRRLDPGTLQIQGHDPTTDLRFRNIRVVELSKQ